MRRIIFVSVMTFMFQFCFSQAVDEVQLKRNYLKAYFNLSDYNRFMSSPRFAIGRTSQKDNFHELELSEINFSGSSNDQEDVGGFRIGMKYEYGLQLFKNIEMKKFQSFLGFATNAGMSHLVTVPKEDSTLFTQSRATNYLNAQLVPRMIYNIHPRFFLELSVPLNLISYTSSSIKTNDPSIPLDLQKVTTKRLLIGSSNSVRASLAFRF